jgi:hypothetical protein
MPPPLWRRRSPANVADPRSGGKHHIGRGADVRAIDQLPVRRRDPTRRARSRLSGELEKP